MRRGFVAALAMIGACSPPEPPRPSLTEAPTHVRYSAALSEFGLDKTALGQDWLQAAGAVLADPIGIALPFAETGYFTPNAPTAVAYRFDLRRGRRLLIEVTLESPDPTRLFVDLFEAPPDGPVRLVASTAPDERRLDYEARRDVPHVLRVQPELLRGGRFSITERTLASLGFPLQGTSLGAVRSGFGVPRDGGRRSHHGIDIFAPRGTPVVAAVDGRVRIDTGHRGGNVIWLSPSNGRRGRLYYAHLDGWAVENGAEVRAGDVIGFVGNTGNARTTPPHLHFGVYDRGPVDPHPYLIADDRLPTAPDGPLDLVLAWARVSARGASLREQPAGRARERRALARGDAVLVRAAAGRFFRVELPDGIWGWVAADELTPLAEPLSTATVAGGVDVRDRPFAHGARISTVVADSRLDVLAQFGDYRLVRLPDQRVGWVAADVDIP